MKKKSTFSNPSIPAPAKKSAGREKMTTDSIRQGRGTKW